MDLDSIAMMGNEVIVAPPAVVNINLDNRINIHLKGIAAKSVRPKLTATCPIRASSIPYICPREEVWYALTEDYQPKPLAHMEMIFEFGNAYQDLVRNKYLGPMGLLAGTWACGKCGCVSETKLMPDNFCHGSWHYVEDELYNEEHNITGHPDGVLLIDGASLILEIKTCNEFFFKSIKNYGLTNPFIKKYLIQVNLYMWMAGIYDAAFLFFNKNTGEMRSIQIKYDNNVVNNAIAFVGLIRKHIVDQTLPQCICDKAVHANLSL